MGDKFGNRLFFVILYGIFYINFVMISDEKMYLKSATVVTASGDHSCLYHSLSFNLNLEKLYYEDGFSLRHELNKFIRANLTKEICTAPEFCETFEEAIIGDDFTPSGYFDRMSLPTSWGGVIEIIATAELFEVNVDLYERTSDQNPFFFAVRQMPIEHSEDNVTKSVKCR